MRNAELNQIKDLARRSCNRTFMFAHFRLLIALLILLATALAGGPRVHAMGADANLIAIVICSENGAETVYVNGGGAPSLPATDCAKCPICIALSVPALAAPDQIEPVRTARRYRRVHSARTAVRKRRYVHPQSRGPPLTATASANSARGPLVAIDAKIATRDSTKVKCIASGMCHRFGRYLEDAR